MPVMGTARINGGRVRTQFDRELLVARTIEQTGLDDLGDVPFAQGERIKTHYANKTLAR